MELTATENHLNQDFNLDAFFGFGCFVLWGLGFFYYSQ